MLTKYVKVANSSVESGFITHEDQEENGLAFDILCEKDSYTYVQASGDENTVNIWVTRVSGEVITDEDMTNILASLPPSQKKIIAELQQRVELAESALNDLLLGGGA